MAENTSFEGIDKSNPTTPSPPPRTPTITVTSGFNMGFMPYQSSLFGNTSNAFHNVANYDGGYFPMTHPPISFTHMLSGPTSMQQQCHTPFSSGVHINPHTEGPSVLEQRGSKRMSTSTCDENSSTDPKRRRRRNDASKGRSEPIVKSKSGSHRFWQSKHDDILIPFLAKMAKSGQKADKNFKRTAFNMAAVHMNEHFDGGFTTEHVINHMKSLRTRFHDMQYCRNLSGAGWDESTSTIIMDKDCFDRWSEDKNLSSSKLKEYINKPLAHYEDLAIIIGDDQAKGDYSKDFNTHFGGSAPINIGDDDDSPLSNQHSPHIHNVDEDDSPIQAKETFIPKPTTNLQNEKNGKGGTSKGKGNGRSDTDNEFMQQMIYQDPPMATTNI